jgi:hypothetical protein
LTFTCWMDAYPTRRHTPFIDFSALSFTSKFT